MNANEILGHVLPLWTAALRVVSVGQGLGDYAEAPENDQTQASSKYGFSRAAYVRQERGKSSRQKGASIASFCSHSNLMA